MVRPTHGASCRPPFTGRPAALSSPPSGYLRLGRFFFSPHRSHPRVVHTTSGGRSLVVAAQPVVHQQDHHVALAGTLVEGAAGGRLFAALGAGGVGQIGRAHV